MVLVRDMRIEAHGSALTAPHQHVLMVLRQISPTKYHAALEDQLVRTKVPRVNGVLEEEDVVAVKVSILTALMVLYRNVLMALSPLKIWTSLVHQVAQNAPTKLVRSAWIGPKLPTWRKVKEMDSVTTESAEGRAQKRAGNL